jgi:hypothetical protein
VAIRWKALRFGPLEAVAVLSLSVAAVAWAAPRPGIRERIAREERAAGLVLRVAAAERAFLARKVLDADGDGRAEYGTLLDLARAGLLDRTPRSDAQGDHLEESGYRIEVLLPGGPMRGGGTALARSREKADPALAADLFAVVCLPTAGAGLRATYVDAAGRIYDAEGISDDEGAAVRTFPARVLLAEEEDLKDGSTVWHWINKPAKTAPKAR